MYSPAGLVSRSASWPGGPDGHDFLQSRRCNRSWGGELNVLVPPLGGPVVTGDDSHPVQAAEVAVGERVPGLGVVTSTVGEPQSLEAEPVTPAQAQPVIVTLPAEIDMANADSIGKQLAAASGPSAAVVIADMTATTFCDSVGMRMLVLAAARPSLPARTCGWCCRAPMSCASWKY